MCEHTIDDPLFVVTHACTHILYNIIDPSLKRLQINELSIRLIQFSPRWRDNAIRACHPRNHGNGNLYLNGQSN